MSLSLFFPCCPCVPNHPILYPPPDATSSISGDSEIHQVSMISAIKDIFKFVIVLSDYIFWKILKTVFCGRLVNWENSRHHRTVSCLSKWQPSRSTVRGFMTPNKSRLPNKVKHLSSNWF